MLPARSGTTLLLLAALALCAAPPAVRAADPLPLATPDPATIHWPAGAPPTAAEVMLGKTLFFDRRLSRNQTQSCATCHDPARGTGDGLPLGVGAEGQRLQRHTPHLYNLAWGTSFFWDGRAATLEDQALAPITSTAEMNMPLDLLVGRLQAVPWYRDQVHAIYGSDEVTPERVAKALAAFERTLVSRHSPFDRYLAGDHSALGESALRGLKLFQGPAWCSLCHEGPNLTDNRFHNIGVRDKDPGRAAIAPGHRMQGAHKTPGLRNVALTAPYMHNGSEATLEDVVRFYNRGGDDHARRDPTIRELNLGKRDIADLVEFMKALTDPVPVEPPPIP